jgi:anti-sigma factor RsiW
MTTKSTETLLSAYADGELDTCQAAQVETMIARDPDLARIVDSHRQVTALLRAACAEHVYERALPVLPAISPGRPRLRPILERVAAAAIVVVIGFAGGLNWQRWAADPLDHLLDEVAEYHEVYQKETRHLVEVPASRMDELVAWLGSRIGRDIIVPDLSFAGLTFAGGRMLVVGGAPVAALIFTRANGMPIALCIGEADRHGPMTPVRLHERHDLLLASWHHGGQDFVLVGQMDKATARALADRTRKQYAG